MISNYNCIDDIYYTELREKILIYFKKSGKAHNPCYISYFHKFLKHLDKYNIKISHVTKEITDSFLLQSRRIQAGFKPIRDFFIKERIISIDTNNKFNSFNNQNLEVYIKPYLESKEMEGLRARSIDGYRRKLIEFAGYIKQQGIYYISEVTQDIVENYLFHLLNYKGLKTLQRIRANSVRAKIFVVRSYFHYLLKNNYIEYDPCVLIKVPKKEKILSNNYLTLNEMKGFLNEIKIVSVDDIMDKVLIEATYNLGLRVSEIVSIRKEHINFESGMIYIVEGKGGRPRYIPMNKYIRRLLSVYLNYVHNKLFNNSKGYLFLNSKSNSRLSARKAQDILRNRLKKSSIKKEITFHMLRKSIGKHLLESGLDIRYVQKFLGHNNINSTTSYTQLSIEDLKKALKDFHPRETEKKTYLLKIKFKRGRNA